MNGNQMQGRLGRSRHQSFNCALNVHELAHNFGGDFSGRPVVACIVGFHIECFGKARHHIIEFVLEQAFYQLAF